MKKQLGLLAVAAVAALAVACSSSAESTPTPTSVPVPTATPTAVATEKTVVDIAVEDGRFETLVTAVAAADLAGTLSGDGPFTVFAPTDEAFGALPEGTVEGLLADIPALTDVLTYHVVSGSVLAADVIDLNSAPTLQGSDVSVRVESGKVFINDAQVVITDILASNGVIHVIDSVLLPPADETEETPAPAPTATPEASVEATIVDIALGDGRFTTLVAALQAADLAGTLSGDGPFTVFAPTDDAFAALPEGTVEALLADIPALTDVLLYHVLEGAVDAETALGAGLATTVQGSNVVISDVLGNVVLDHDALVIQRDIAVSNGIIHVINRVLIP